MNFRVPKQKNGISWLVEDLLDSREGLCSVEFVTQIVEHSASRQTCIQKPQFISRLAVNNYELQRVSIPLHVSDNTNITWIIQQTRYMYRHNALFTGKYLTVAAVVVMYNILLNLTKYIDKTWIIKATKTNTMSLWSLATAALFASSTVYRKVSSMWVELRQREMESQRTGSQHSASINGYFGEYW